MNTRMAKTACKNVARRAFAAAGLEVVRRPARDALPISTFDRRRSKLLRSEAIDLVLDVGASRGYYGLTLRQTGYGRRIVSFEPLSTSYATLTAHARGDALWASERVALGAMDGEALIHVAGNAVSSSFLPMAERHECAAPEACYVADELVPICRLDTIAELHIDESTRAYLKMDVQGYEDQILEGATQTLSRVALIESELSLCPLYDGQLLYTEMIALLEELGFELVAVEEGFVDYAAARTLQLNGIFARRGELQALPAGTLVGAALAE